jgi:hypothetical protein
LIKDLEAFVGEEPSGTSRPDDDHRGRRRQAKDGLDRSVLDEDPTDRSEKKQHGNRALQKDTDQSYNGPTVLVLNGASKSLVESDFYRLARQGQHLDGWASSILKGKLVLYGQL